MGGSIAVTWRKLDGTVVKMSRWTNVLPWALTNLGLITDDEKHVDAYLKSWFEMKDDWDANKDAKQFKLPMTDSYFPYFLLAPDGYGLVVVDQVNKVILHSQGYTSIGDVIQSSVLLDVVQEKKDGQIDIDEDSDAARFFALLEAGKVTGREWWGDGDGKKEILPETRTSKEIVEDIKRDYNNKTRQLGFGSWIVDMSPYKVERFAEYDFQAAQAMYNRVKELGFVLTPEDEVGWVKWLSRLDSESAEDEDGDDETIP